MQKSRRKTSCSSDDDVKMAPSANPGDDSHLNSLEGKSRQVINQAKCNARPELKKTNSWCAHKYYKTFERDFPVIDPTVPNNIEYVDMNKISTEEFEKHYVKNKIPCMMLNSQTGWQATKKWTKHRLAKKYRNQSFKCGEDDDGHNVKLKMKYYLEYAESTTDDSPLYIFEGNYGEHKKNRQILEDYEIPGPFKDDMFNYVSNRRRPPHRWFVMGPARSGTGIHIDPLGTSAWNALISGHKRWFLLDGFGN